uniref:Derlin n=1 Tax=Arcella intermedia TaxID=1963864 RepID=A0A6B2LG84_9EUKA
MPPVTRWLFTGSFVVTLAANFSLLSPMSLILHYESIFYNFELWRLVTAFLYHGRLGFPFLINMMFLVRYGASVEKDTFMNETADYLWMIILGCITLFLPGFYIPLFILGESLIMMIIYYWSRVNPNIPMSFFFGFRFESRYFPWVLIGFRLLMGGMPIDEIVGVFVGHLYYFMAVIYPNQGGRRWIKTPQLLKDYFPGPNARIPRPGEGPRATGYNWGPGRPLGAIN